MARKIRDLMTTDVRTATPDATLRDVAAILKEEDIGSLPVCEGRKVVGVVTDRDIAIRGVAEGRDPASMTAGEIMSSDVVAVRENAGVREATRLMREHQLRRLPVLNDDGELVGYLALARVARTQSPEQSGKVLRDVSQEDQGAAAESTSRPKRRRSTG
jgi:CBS domain-containing protein